jgi:hypothetical protein
MADLREYIVLKIYPKTQRYLTQKPFSTSWWAQLTGGKK